MLWLILVACLAVGVHAEVFTAMADMRRLLATEGEMIRAVENYIMAQEEKLEKLKK